MGLLPVGARFLADSMRTCKEFELIDIKDYLFIALALNLSNIILAEHLKFEGVKQRSIYLNIYVAVILGVAFMREAHCNKWK